MKRLDLSGVLGTCWLAEPSRFRPYVVRALSFPDCPGAREVIKARRRALEEAKAAPGRALESTGRTDPGELQLAGGGKAVRAVKGRVGVIPVYGPIDQRRGAELMKAGGTSCEEIQAALDALLMDKSVDAVVLDIDSPGGSSFGIEELSDRIFRARREKTLYACANSLMASAAFWLGTSAEVVCCTPGGDVGSVGVYAMHLDQSAADEEEGVKVTFVSEGRYKTEGNPHEPLTKEAADYIQSQVSYTYDRFCEALKRNRDVSIGHVRDRFGQGRVMNAEAAASAGMCDRVLSLDDLLAKLTGGGSNPAGGRGASTQMMRLRLDHERRKGALPRAGR